MRWLIPLLPFAFGLALGAAMSLAERHGDIDVMGSER